MSQAASETSVTRSITVRVPIEHAFRVFTERFDLWWSREHHIGKVAMERAVMEAREGGRWYERGVDGSECDWGKVLAWSPPNRVALSWHISPMWTCDPDPAHASRVDVTFHAEGEAQTRVDLVHADLDRHGEGWQRLREAVASSGGWQGLLDRYATSVGG